MSFVHELFQWFADSLDFIGSLFSDLFDLLMKPLSLLFYFLDGVFYFITVLFNIAVKAIMIFVALFQFIMALIAGVLRTIQDLLSPSFNTASVNFPSTSKQGFDTVIDILMPTGFMDIIPYILLAFVWSAFIYKILALFAGNLIVKGGD